MATVTLEDIHKTFTPSPLAFRPGGGKGGGSKRFAIRHLHLTIPNARTTVILGPSGCGKTTLLRIIAGLLAPDRGRIFFDGEDMTGRPPRDRQLGMVFQDFALYPHLTNRTNILAYFFFRRGPRISEEARDKFARTSRLMGIDIAYLLDRRPVGLSPGEKQRVALARCITRDPRLFLLDEPFSHLDQPLREKYRVNLKKLLDAFRITTVYVTHDQQEARLLADSIVLMDDGRIRQTGSYRDLYLDPIDAFVAGFLNADPLTPAINFLDGALVAPDFAGSRLGVRPEDVVLGQEGGYGVDAEVEDRFDAVATRSTILTATVTGEAFYASLPQTDRVIPGRVRLGLGRFFLFDPESGDRVGTYP